HRALHSFPTRRSSDLSSARERSVLQRFQCRLQLRFSHSISMDMNIGYRGCTVNAEPQRLDVSRLAAQPGVTSTCANTAMQIGSKPQVILHSPLQRAAPLSRSSISDEMQPLYFCSSPHIDSFNYSSSFHGGLLSCVFGNFNRPGLMRSLTIR